MSQMLQAWQAGMLTEAPNPDKLMPGRLQAYARIPRQLFSVAGSRYKSAEINLNWFSKGIKLNIAPILHSSHDKALQWHKHVRFVKHMLANTIGKDNGNNYLEADRPSPGQYQPQVSRTYVCRTYKEHFTVRGSNRPGQGSIA